MSLLPVIVLSIFGVGLLAYGLSEWLATRRQKSSDTEGGVGF